MNVVVTNFVRISHEAQTICINLCHFCVCVCVYGCAWSEGLLFVWAWVHGVCVSGRILHALVVLGFLHGFAELCGTIRLCCL